ncbi:hypothetical protein GCM10020219_075130 [Nonomuraea dietziae]
MLPSSPPSTSPRPPPRADDCSLSRSSATAPASIPCLFALLASSDITIGASAASSFITCCEFSPANCEIPAAACSVPCCPSTCPEDAVPLPLQPLGVGGDGGEGVLVDVLVQRPAQGLRSLRVTRPVRHAADDGAHRRLDRGAGLRGVGAQQTGDLLEPRVAEGGEEFVVESHRPKLPRSAPG